MKNQTQICHDIIKRVATLFGMSMKELTSSKRNREIVDARFIAIWLCKSRTKMSDNWLGRLFGKERSSISYASRKVPDWRQTDPTFRKIFDQITSQIEAGQIIPVDAKAVEPNVEVPINGPWVQVSADIPRNWNFVEYYPGYDPGMATFSNDTDKE